MKCGSLRNAMGECDSEVNFLFVRLKRKDVVESMLLEKDVMD